MLPWPLPKLFGALINAVNRRDPAVSVALGGTVAVTAVGMFGHNSGWGLVPFPQSLGLVVGGIARKPVLVDDRIEPREVLNLTVAFDHDVVDGAPAARFVQRLVELIEGGYGLAEIEPAIYQYATLTRNPLRPRRRTVYSDKGEKSYEYRCKASQFHP